MVKDLIVRNIIEIYPLFSQNHKTNKFGGGTNGEMFRLTDVSHLLIFYPHRLVSMWEGFVWNTEQENKISV